MRAKFHADHTLTFTAPQAVADRAITLESAFTSPIRLHGVHKFVRFEKDGAIAHCQDVIVHALGKRVLENILTRINLLPKRTH
jgi:hypothetical protein